MSSRVDRTALHTHYFQLGSRATCWTWSTRCNEGWRTTEDQKLVAPRQFRRSTPTTASKSPRHAGLRAFRGRGPGSVERAAAQSQFANERDGTRRRRSARACIYRFAAHARSAAQAAARLAGSPTRQNSKMAGIPEEISGKARRALSSRREAVASGPPRGRQSTANLIHEDARNVRGIFHSWASEKFSATEPIAAAQHQAGTAEFFFAAENPRSRAAKIRSEISAKAAGFFRRNRSAAQRCS